ncbi:cytochrome c biogenesis protein CcsA [Nonlabens marinus]|uniref:Putative cytochrome C-type biogenesis protein n=1 Tax=Nonlabens marinus S1-08 TaxID=1454201 RepID=W8VSK3_9FLAO|nr:cytochrome c biogenesis protein CcsA [Nonlabens marinus]BAO56275.1 putative cytochrome C-type biogenesis protein [Nonlabens marinus S1-08]
MKDRIQALLFSTRTMSVLLLTFAISMAVGTFIENSYDTPTSKLWVYNTWWFSLLMFWLMLNFIGNIKRYQLWQWKKWATLTMHLSWILIIIGAGITRYISYEGMMLIREGQTENTFLSDETYYSVLIQGNDPDGNPMQREVKEKVLITQYDYDHTETFDYYDQEISFTIDTLIYDAVEGLKLNDTGGKYLKIVETAGGNRHDHLIKDGEEASIHGVLFAVNKDPEEAQEKGMINIIENWNGYSIQTPFAGDYFRMADQQKGDVYADSLQPLQLRSLYNMAGMQFVIPEPIQQGEVGIVASSEPTAAKAYGLIGTVRSGDEEKRIEMRGGKGIESDYSDVELNGMKFYIKYGSISKELPFSITLEDFIATKYPGTEKGYSAFESKVVVNDADSTMTQERIYMNNVLDKDGYRFFQSGFDPDELGTHLSVNHDFWGKLFSYAGYILLYIAMMALIFDKNTRFGELRRLINRIEKRKSKYISILIIGLGTSLSYAQTPIVDHTGHNHAVQPAVQEDHTGHDHEVNDNDTSMEVREGGVSTNMDADAMKTTEAGPITPQVIPEIPLRVLDSIIVANMVPQAQADRFGRVVVQDNGRMKPMSTLASEILRRMSERDYYEAKVGDSTVRLSPEQTLISMMQFGQLWFEVPVIKLNRKNDSIKNVLDLDTSRSYASGMDFFRKPNGEVGGYKLSPFLDAANSADVKTNIQNEFIDINFSVGLLDQVITGSILKIFPNPNAENNKWFARPELEDAGFEREGDYNFVRDFIPAYTTLLNEGNQTGDYLRANTALNSLFEFQKAYGGDIIPSLEKIEAEILYNKYDVFKGLYKWYVWFGVVMLILLVVEIVRPMKEIRWAIVFHKYAVVGIFLVHTIALGVRWYLSGHAPWSDAYESLIYVAWATMAFGLMFGRKSEMTIASTAFVVAIILWVAQLNWLDPSIANLQPVLDSYWLMIHVAVIVGSYGPFALGMILGIVSMILMIFSTEKNKKKMDLNIKELTYINEVSLTVGLIMLTIGNFLGAMWANESWGRYWGWDPKETWALITIFVYAFVLHLRLVPGLKGRWTFNLWSVLAFYSVMMTYFGVNFYLSGLHSYASGDQIFSYQAVVISLAVIGALAAVARWREKKVYGKKRMK